MKIEPITVHGSWWLPGKQSNPSAGTLKISQTGRIKLELFGPSEQPILARAPISNIEHLHGITDDGKLITLYKCGFTNRLDHNKTSMATLFIRFAFFGRHLTVDDASSVSDVILNTEGFADWLGISGATVMHNWARGHHTIRYRLPKVKNYKIHKDLNLSIAFTASYPMAGSVHETKIAQTAAIKLELLKPLSLEQTLLLVYRINSFLCFAFDQPSALIAVSILPLGVTQTRPKAKNEKREADTQLFYASLPQSEEPPDLTGFRQLLPFAGIEKIFGRLLSAWLAEYDTVEPALEAYLLATTVQHARLETKFLILVQGLESLHRRSSEATTMSQQEFDQILAGLLSACPSNHKDWLKTRLKYANELSLRHRLRALCSPFVNLLAPQNVGKLIDDILNTRNYLTHFDKSLEAAAKSGVDLWSLCDKLEVIFKFQILRKLNFTDQEIRSIPATNSDIARKLGLLT